MIFFLDFLGNFGKIQIILIIIKYKHKYMSVLLHEINKKQINTLYTLYTILYGYLFIILM